MQLDHIVIAYPDLAAAGAEFAAQTGCTPADGGAHIGRGTRNLLVSLGRDGSYIELIGPDPEQDIAGTGGETFAALSGPQLLHWAVRSRDLATHPTTRLRDAGLNPSSVFDVSRRTPDGTLLEWQLMGVGGHDLGGCVPFWIDWLDCEHPADNTPVAGSIVHFDVRLPDHGGDVGRLLGLVDEVTLSSGPPRLQLSIETSNGVVTWQQDEPPGFSF